MVKKSLLWVCRSLLWLVVAAFAILLITALTINFWLMPNINQYKQKIADFATQTTKQKVAIGHIKASWLGFNPHLSISNIDIFDAENRPALQLRNTNITVSWLSIPLLEPHLATISIRSPELTIRRVASGEIFVAGMSMLGESNPALANWLLRQSNLEISDAKIIWLDEKRNAPSLSLNKVSIEIYTPPWIGFVKNHLVKISALPSVGTNQPILVSGDLYGEDISRSEQWYGQINIQLKDADLTAFKPWFNYPINLQSGVGSADINAEFANKQLQSIKSNVALKNLQLQVKPDASPIMLRQVNGKLSWQNQRQLDILGRNKAAFAQIISVEELSLIANNGLHIKDVTADYTQDDAGKQSLRLKVSHLDLSLAQPFVAQLPLPEAMHQSIIASAPEGALDDLKVTWEAQHQTTTAYKIDAKFHQLTIRAHNTIPGFSNLSGEIQADQKSGQLKLDTKNARLNFKDTLRWPIPVDSLIGEIAWQMRDKVTTIDVNNLSINNQHLSGVINANYIMDGNKGGFLDLKGKFDKGNAKYALFYYPVTLGKETLHWLDTSILDGRIEGIDVTVKGRLADFPFVNRKNIPDPQLGTFKVTAKLSDILLEYGTGWPKIEKLGLNLLFEGKRMELNAHTGRILGKQIIKSKATIAQLDADYPMLMIDSELIGPVSEGINFVNKSPVKEVTQGFTEDLKTGGNGKLYLGLKIPMQDLEAAQYKGLYQISDGKIESASFPSLSQINGALEFTESSLTAKNIKAVAFGSPLVFNLASGQDKSMRVAARGRLSNENLQQMLTSQNLAKATQYISGGTDWVADILMQKSSLSIGIRSDLIGITSHLPAPLNKSATQPFSLRVDKKMDASTHTLIVSLNNNINARLVRSLSNGKMQTNYAAIHLGGNIGSFHDASTDTTKPKGIQITGSLDYLDADAWRGVMSNLKNTQITNGLPIQKVALKINTLDIFNRRLNQLTISKKSTTDGFQANIQSREITGDLQWLSQNNGKLIGRLSNLTMPESAPDKISAATDANTQNTSPQQFIKLEQDYPALDIVAENFEFNKKNFGVLELIAYPQNDNWDIQKLKLITPESIITAEGQWNNWTRSPNTHLNVSWDIKDLGKTLGRFGYADTIKGGEGMLSGTLYWPGSPHQFDTSRLSGDLQFEVRKGQILKVRPGAGRLLGLLSLQNLPRRLTLDFRDLFSSGFAFDKINATVKIDKGIMRSNNFKMTGPAAVVTIKGETNLQKETQHLFVKVLPRISDSISLAALAGGPLAGALAFLTQKLLKDPLNKIISSEYEIIGTWDNPQEVKSNHINKHNPLNNNSPLN